MTTDATPTDADAAQRHRLLRQQWLAEQRQPGDGHGRGRRPAATMNELKKRRARRKGKQRARATLTQTPERAS